MGPPPDERERRAADAARLLGSDGVLLLTKPHEASDITLVCQAGPRRAAQAGPDEVRFYCHRAVLETHCDMFAGMRRFKELSGRGDCGSGAEAASVVEVPFFDDVVFEALRFVYCGFLFLPLGFRHRLAEFLCVAHFLGLEEAALFEEPGLRRALTELDPDELAALLGESRDVGSLPEGMEASLANLPGGVRSRLLQEAQARGVAAASGAPALSDEPPWAHEVCAQAQAQARGAAAHSGAPASDEPPWAREACIQARGGDEHPGVHDATFGTSRAPALAVGRAAAEPRSGSPDSSGSEGPAAGLALWATTTGWPVTVW